MLRTLMIASLAIGSALAEASVPKGATEIEPGVFKHTDAAGKTFIFRKTPFGVVKSAESADAARKAAEPVAEPVKEAAKAEPTASPFGNVKAPAKTQEGAQGIKAVERGNVVEFERPSPFGSYRWKRNKSELTPEEREAWIKATRPAAAGTKE